MHTELLRLKRHQVDFLSEHRDRAYTKNGTPRDIPMNHHVREALAELGRNKRPDDYVLVNPRTKSCLQETKTAFDSLIPIYLAWAAEQKRVVVTHDRRTMPSHASARIAGGEKVAGVIVVSRRLSVSQVIYDLEVIVNM
ncbi:MAG TPA: hypothetical protein VN920_16860 [Pyrinomonadaceae bacterium]|nr:hypothetical protein [Pyrinomonadaceae bacterium]